MAVIWLSARAPHHSHRLPCGAKSTEKGRSNSLVNIGLLKVGKSIISPLAAVSTQLDIAFYEISLVPGDGKAIIV
jgi:hypothetical protein